MIRSHWFAGAAGAGLLAAALAWLGGPAATQLGPQTTGDAALAADVRAAIGDRTGYRGLAVALVENGTVRLAGLGERGHGDGVDPDTAFEIGSVGKAITGMLLANMIDDGVVAPDDPLRSLLPDPDLDGSEVGEITLAELASHRSGLPRIRISGPWQALVAFSWNLGGHDPYAGQDTDWLGSTLDGASRDSGEPTISYSNYGFAVLGYALAERAGVPYPQLVTDRVLAPLGMSATGFHLDGAALPGHRASGGTTGGRPMDPWQGSGYAPAGIGAWSTASDLARLVSAMLDRSAPGADAATGRFEESATSHVGYGWWTDRIDGQEITWHNGGTGGFGAFVGFHPEAERGVVVLGNTDRSVDSLGLALLTGSGHSGGPDGAGLPLVLVTVGLSLFGGLSLASVGWRSRVDRLGLASQAAWALAGPALAAMIGAWHTVPTWVWAIGVGLSAAGLVLAVRRWPGAEWYHGRYRWAGWSGAVISIVGAAATVGWAAT